MVTDDKLAFWREELDSIDFELLDLLEKRFEVTKKIGDYKKERGIVIEDKKREDEALNARIGKSDLHPEFLKKLFELVFEESKRMQREQ